MTYLLLLSMNNTTILKSILKTIMLVKTGGHENILIIYLQNRDW